VIQYYDNHEEEEKHEPMAIELQLEKEHDDEPVVSKKKKEYNLPPQLTATERMTAITYIDRMRADNLKHQNEKDNFIDSHGWTLMFNMRHNDIMIANEDGLMHDQLKYFLSTSYKKYQGHKVLTEVKNTYDNNKLYIHPVLTYDYESRDMIGITNMKLNLNFNDKCQAFRFITKYNTKSIEISMPILEQHIACVITIRRREETSTKTYGTISLTHDQSKTYWYDLESVIFKKFDVKDMKVHINTKQNIGTNKKLPESKIGRLEKEQSARYALLRIKKLLLKKDEITNSNTLLKDANEICHDLLSLGTFDEVIRNYDFVNCKTQERTNCIIMNLKEKLTRFIDINDDTIKKYLEIQHETKGIFKRRRELNKIKEQFFTINRISFDKYMKLRQKHGFPIIKYTKIDLVPQNKQKR